MWYVFVVVAVVVVSPIARSKLRLSVQPHTASWKNNWQRRWIGSVSNAVSIQLLIWYSSSVVGVLSIPSYWDWVCNHTLPAEPIIIAKISKYYPPLPLNPSPMQFTICYRPLNASHILFNLLVIPIDKKESHYWIKLFGYSAPNLYLECKCNLHSNNNNNNNNNNNKRQNILY